MLNSLTDYRPGDLDDEFLEQDHIELVQNHERAKKSHERIKKHHHTVMAHLTMLKLQLKQPCESRVGQH